MTLNSRQRAGLLLTLALVMMGTRINHFSALPDASWALFFVGGFYLRGWDRWAFPALMVLAVAVDYVVIRASGLSFWDHYCVSAAYWFLLPSYLSLWLGGVWLRRNYAGLRMRSAAQLVAALLASASLCFLLSNGSFYWWSGIVAQPTFVGWTENLRDWYLPYLYTASLYTGFAAIVHVAIAQVAARLPARREAPATAR